jgi:hypothetical protein
VILKRHDGIYYMDIDLDISVSPGAVEQGSYLDEWMSDGVGASAVYYFGQYTEITMTPEFYTNGVHGTLMLYNTSTNAYVDITRPTHTTVRTVEDVSVGNYRLGIQYGISVELGPIYKRNHEGRPERTGRMQLRYVDINYHDTTDFQVVHTLPGSRSYTRTLSQASPRDGTLRVPIMGRAEDATITISDTSGGGVRLSSIDWEGYEHKRHNRRA